MKKLFTFVLALVASVSAIYAQSGSCGDNLTWTLSNGTLTISGTGAMKDYEFSSDVPWYNYREVIKSVIIAEGVTGIGWSAFYDCKSLTSITIPNSVISIGERAFYGCESLTSITIGNSMTSIGGYAFYGCSSLTSITIPNSVTSIGWHAFSGCSSLASITIPNSVTSIGEETFRSCSSLKSITIPNSVTSIGDEAFLGCSSLTSVTIPNSVTSIGEYAFSGCESLTSITIPNSVTSIGDYAFYGCFSFTSVTIGNGVTSIGSSAFWSCSSLISINVDANNPNYCSIDGVLFDKDKTTLIQYPIGNTRSEYIIPNSVTSIGDGAFAECSSLTSFTIPNSVTSIGRGAFGGTGIYTNAANWKNGALYINNCLIGVKEDFMGDYTIKAGTRLIAGGAFEDCTSLTSVTIPNSVTSIGKSAFLGCESLTSITIPNSVTSIGDGAFAECSSLTSITIPNSVTSIGWNAFYGCESLTSITIGNSMTSIGGYAFYGCSSLTSITIPNSVTSIGFLAFYRCSSLTSVILTALSEEEFSKGQGNSLLYSEGVRCQREIQINGTKVTKFTIPNSVTSIGERAFYRCSSLTSVTIPNSVASIGDYAFYECSKLTSITIPNSVTSIEYGAFHDCSSLTSVTIGNSVTSIRDETFYGCSNITSVTWNAKNCNSYNFGSQVTSFEFGDEVEVIPSSLCKGMEKLTSITIPNSVTSIGSGAFYGCSNITSVTWNAKNCNSYNFGSQVASFEFGKEVEAVPSSLCKGMEKLTSIAIPNSVKTIGASAFKGCVRLGKVSLGKNLETIGVNAFAECTRLYDIYVYATYPPFAEESSFANYNVYVYIPCEYQRDYTLDVVWGKFRFIECISSDNVTTDEIVVTPSENEANVTWPSVTGAATYELVIKDKDGNIVCTLIFNANGQLTSIAFNAPSRNGVPAQTQSAGFSFTITGLDSGTGYDLTLTAKDNSGNIIEETTIPFHTDYPEGIENVQGNEVQSTKVIKDGQVLILRNGKTYTMQGQEVK